MSAIDDAWSAIGAEHDMQRAIRAWLGLGGTGRYVVDASIPTRTLDGATALLGYVIGGVLYIHPDRKALIDAAMARATTPPTGRADGEGW